MNQFIMATRTSASASKLPKRSMVHIQSIYGDLFIWKANKIECTSARESVGRKQMTE